MLISATEFKSNMGKYLDTAIDEDIFVTRKGKLIAKISNPANDKMALLNNLAGIAEGCGLTAEQARGERLSRK